MVKAIILWDGNCFLAVLIPAVSLAFRLIGRLMGSQEFAQKLFAEEERQIRGPCLLSLRMTSNSLGERAIFTHNLQMITGIFMDFLLI